MIKNKEQLKGTICSVLKTSQEENGIGATEEELEGLFKGVKNGSLYNKYYAYQIKKGKLEEQATVITDRFFETCEKLQ